MIEECVMRGQREVMVGRRKFMTLAHTDEVSKVANILNDIQGRKGRLNTKNSI